MANVALSNAVSSVNTSTMLDFSERSLNEIVSALGSVTYFSIFAVLVFS